MNQERMRCQGRRRPGFKTIGQPWPSRLFACLAIVVTAMQLSSCLEHIRLEGRYHLLSATFFGVTATSAQLQEAGIDTDSFYVILTQDDLTVCFGADEKTFSYSRMGRLILAEGDPNTKYVFKEGEVTAETRNGFYSFEIEHEHDH